MRIAVWGGTGYTGRSIVSEAVARGHEVTVWSRSAPSEPIAGAHYRQGSLLDAADRSSSLEADVVVVSVSPRGDMAGGIVRPAIAALAEEATHTGTRLAVVGGAGSLLVEAGGPRVVDLPEFAEEYRAEATEFAEVLDDLRASAPELDWFLLSPPNHYGAHVPFEATGSYRVGGDVALSALDASGQPVGPGGISAADFALAFVDEIEHPQHARSRFTVAN